MLSDRLISSVPNDPSLVFRPGRANEQCKGCGQWGHRSNSCFILPKVFWCIKFINEYPCYVKHIAEQYRAYNLRSQRSAQVRMLCSLIPMSDDVTEDEILDQVAYGDEYFLTDIEEPSSPKHPVDDLE